MNTRTLAQCALAAALGALAVHKTASVLQACGGSPPAPFCSQSVSKIISVTKNIAYDGSSQLIEIPFGVFVTQFGFPTPDECPPGDIILTGELTLTCPVGPPILATIGPVIVDTGLNQLSTFVIVPSGLSAPTICTLSGFVDVAFPNGAVLRAECATELCLTEPAADDPSVPRLAAELVSDPINNPIQATHPGDPTAQVWRITNNDPVHAFEGVVTGRSMNNTRMPGEVVPGPPGSGAFAISDPIAGDNFPIEFFDPGSDPFTWITWPCVDLSASPHDPAVPEKTLSLSLAPGESIDIGLAVRPWGVCASGSGCRVPLEVSGTFEDGTEGFACVNGVAYADASVPPMFLCDDGGAGSASQIVPGFTAPDSLEVFCDPGIDPYTCTVKIELVELNLKSPAPIQILPQSGTFSQTYGRVQHEVTSADPDQPLAPVGSFFDVVYRIDVQPSPKGPPVNLELLQMMLLEGIPGGFENTAPILKGTVAVSGPDLSVDSFFDVVLQFSGDIGFCDDGNACTKTYTLQSIQPDGPSSVLLHFSGQLGADAGGELTGPVAIDGQALNAAYASAHPGADLRGPGFVHQVNFRTDVRAFAYLGAAPPCPWDVTGTGSVGSADLGFLLGCWGVYAPGDSCEVADFTASGTIGSADLGTLLGNWGPCP
ncbi:MAG: hypothetical protein EA376_05345 [Phycisphaeraceae bacterium]|nr:MAG: hypothetical protein EA376_05345 [Phycisphaeraceae bacterium]